jgi:uncharacterized UPF0160 family protein
MENTVKTTDTTTAANYELVFDSSELSFGEEQCIFEDVYGKAKLVMCPDPEDYIKLAVHDGQFHADDVLSVVLMELFWLGGKADVVRTRDSDLLGRCIRLDVGEGLLDHHGRAAEAGVAACTKVWALLRQSGLVPPYAVAEIDDIVRAVAAWDTGTNTVPHPLPYVGALSGLASAYEAGGYCGTYAMEDCGYDHQFNRALDMTRCHIKAILGRATAAYAAETCALRCIEAAGDNQVVVFDRESRCAPVKEMLWERKSPAVFYVSPEAEDDWRILCAHDPEALEFSPFNSRKLLNEEFRGLRGDALSEKSGIPGGIFCHAAGFIAGFKTREAAVAFAQMNI